MLGKWVLDYRPKDMTAQLQADFTKENEQLRRENRVLKQGEGYLKNCPRPSPPVCGRNGLWCEGVGGSWPLAYWWHDTPLKNVACGHLRTLEW